MKTDHVQIAFLAIGLILLAALQDMVPPFCGAKPPFLLVFALYVALTASGRPQRNRKGDRPVTRWIWTACAAGYLVEALREFPSVAAPVRVTRLAFGLPADSGVAYSDPLTLRRAIVHRCPA